MRWLYRALGVDRLRESVTSLRSELAKQRGEIEALRERNAQLERALSRTPGLPGAEIGDRVSVGGVEVELYALPPEHYIRALKRLPEFLFTYAAGRVTDQEPGEHELSELSRSAREWLEASLAEEDKARIDFRKLTMPEIQHALAVMARLNGIDEQLASFFLQRGAGGGARRPGSDGAAVRQAAERAVKRHN